MLGLKYELDVYNAGVKECKERCKILNSHLADGTKMFMVGNRFTLADIALFCSVIGAFSTTLDAGFRKAMPAVSSWFERVAQQSAVINTCGVTRLCEKALKPQDPAKAVAVEVPTKAEETKAVDDDDFDPFADDEEEDEEAEKAKQARMKEIAKTAKSYGKVVVAKSIIVWEVKPWGEETDLKELADKILAIEMDGLFWKTEWKKEPIAYGVFKIVIGATVEDDKVSTDTVQEKIEELEDLVQSVDIQSFNKL